MLGKLKTFLRFVSLEDAGHCGSGLWAYSPVHILFILSFLFQQDVESQLYTPATIEPSGAMPSLQLRLCPLQQGARMALPPSVASGQ